ncbi:MAG: AMP-binding protein [Actinomycetota bacterium]
MSGIGAHARATPDATAIVSMGGSVTFAELDHRQHRLAGVLQDAGLEEGDRVAVLSRNSVAMLEVVIACLRMAMIPVPLNALLTEREIGYILEDSGARWLFTDRNIDPPPGLEQIVTFGDAYERVILETEPSQLCDHARGRPMHYTSGTTGVPKGVWIRPYPPKKAARVSADFIDHWGLSSVDIHLVCSPLTHSAPLRYALRTMEAGGTVALQSHFDAAETLAAIDLFNATTTFMVPTHLERILALGTKAIRRHDLSSMRLLVHAGAPIREGTKRAAIEVFPEGSVWEFYGSTEGQATRISQGEWLRKPGSVGKPRPGATIEIRDEDGGLLPPGEIGRVWVKDPKADRFQYWGDRKKTRSAWKAGAFTVGDLGSLDEDGYLFLAGRVDDTIITGGVNVYPQEVEKVLSEHPMVGEVVVYGAPNEEWGQEVRAAVVATGDLDEATLLAWSRDRLAGFKRPRKIDLVAELDRTATGKLIRRAPKVASES